MAREPHWVKLFLRELERTGNVRLAAERAGVDFSTAYQRRKAAWGVCGGWGGRFGFTQRPWKLKPLRRPLHHFGGAERSPSPASGEELGAPRLGSTVSGPTGS